MFKIRVNSKEIRFVNRVRELEKLRELATKGSPLVEFVYGPEGCGKTTLMKYFIHSIKDDKKYTIIYIDAIEVSDPEKALYTNIDITVKEILSTITETFNIPLGGLIALNLSKIISYIVNKFKLFNKNIVIIVDDIVRSIGLDKVECYVKYLYELGTKIKIEHEPESLLILATTSEGVSRRLITKHRHAVIHLLWNLDKKSTEELVEQFSNRNIIEDVWELTGGNPAKIIELLVRFESNIKKWLSKLEERLMDIIHIVRLKSLIKYLRDVVENIDLLYEGYEEGYLKLLEILEESNLVIYKGYSTLSEDHVNPDPVLGIGKYYAWQIPAYAIILRKLLNKS